MTTKPEPVTPAEYVARFDNDQVQVRIKGQWVYLGQLVAPNIGKSEGPHLRFESEPDGPDYDTRREAMHHAVNLMKNEPSIEYKKDVVMSVAQRIALYLHNGELPNND